MIKILIMISFCLLTFTGCIHHGFDYNVTSYSNCTDKCAELGDNYACMTGSISFTENNNQTGKCSCFINNCLLETGKNQIVER